MAAKGVLVAALRLGGAMCITGLMARGGEAVVDECVAPAVGEALLGVVVEYVAEYVAAAVVTWGAWPSWSENGSRAISDGAS